MNYLLTNPILQGSIAAQSLVLYVQNVVSIYSTKEISPEAFANLELGIIYSLYAIREINVNFVRKETDEKANRISSDKHQELYHYDYNIHKLFGEYVSKQTPSWIKYYQEEKTRIIAFNSQNTAQKQTII
jgi:hypothetical protein